MQTESDCLIYLMIFTRISHTDHCFYIGNLIILGHMTNIKNCQKPLLKIKYIKFKTYFGPLPNFSIQL